jgi:hypothetical protein
MTNPLSIPLGEIPMFRKTLAAIATVAALAITCQAANAGGRIDKRVKVTGIVVGAAATATYFSINGWEWKWDGSNAISSAGAYAMTTVGCMAVAPIVATVVVKRPLTMREAHVLAGGCVIPIIGGYLVNAAYNAHPEWEAGSAPRKVRHAKKKKM